MERAILQSVHLTVNMGLEDACFGAKLLVVVVDSSPSTGTLFALKLVSRRACQVTQKRAKFIMLT